MRLRALSLNRRTSAVGLLVASLIAVILPMPSGGSPSLADLRAIRAAAAPLITELANRRLTPHASIAREEDL